jgi:ABC-type transport system substrate-binding protein
LALTISATTKPGNEQAELQMQQALRDVGIDLEIKNYPASVLFAQDGPLYTGKYDLEWSIDTNAPDPDNQGSWSGDFCRRKGANTSFLRDPVITQTSDAAIRTFDRARAKRSTSAKRAHPRARAGRFPLLGDARRGVRRRSARLPPRGVHHRQLELVGMVDVRC